MAVVNSQINPPQIAPPAANYVHGVVSIGASRLLHTSGVVPTAPDGTVASTIEGQAAQVWANIEAILTEAEMTANNIVAVTTYAVPGQDLGAVMAARDQFMGSHRAASTLVIVAELVQPEWKVEVAVVGAA